MLNDLYVVLGVGVEATPKEIKSGYRRLAEELHPDRYGPDTPPFREAQEAYVVLSNPERRRVYDERTEAERQSRIAMRRSFAEPLRPTHPTAEPIMPFGCDPSPIEVSLREPLQTFGCIAESVGKTEKEINGLGPQSGASLGSKAAALLVLSRLR